MDMAIITDMALVTATTVDMDMAIITDMDLVTATATALDAVIQLAAENADISVATSIASATRRAEKVTGRPAAPAAPAATLTRWGFLGGEEEQDEGPAGDLLAGSEACAFSSQQM